MQNIQRNFLRAGSKFLIAALFMGSLHADLTIVQSLKSEDGQNVVETITMQTKGDRTRVDMGDSISTIADNSQRSMITLVHGQKMAMELPENLLGGAGKAAVASKEAEPIEYKPTGRKEVINGYACEEYTFGVNGEQITSWFAKDVAERAAIAEAMGNLSKSGDPMVSPLANFDSMPGIPIRTTIDLPGTGKSILTVESISSQAVPDDRFVVPKGYTQMKMPKIPTGN